jgi:hypothetical protein
MPFRDVIVAALVRMFPNAAKNARRFIGLWNDVDVQNVTMIKLAPRRENIDDTRDVVWRISSWRVVQGILS